MAVKNRTELSTAINSTFVATLQIADHLSFLDGDLLDSLVLREDVIGTVTESGGTATVDFSNSNALSLPESGLT